MPIHAAGNFGTRHSSHLQSFFDRDAVMKAVDKKIRKELGWFGGYCRRVIRNSLKEKDGYSRPGAIPHVHTFYMRKHIGRLRTRLATPKRSLLYKDSILYSYLAKLQEVIIGPFLFNGGDAGNPVPALLEGGGSQLVYRGLRRKKVMAHYRARPHVHPGFQKALDAFRKRRKW